MKKIIWRLRLMFWLIRYGYMPRWNFIWVYQFTKDECWMDYFPDNPKVLVQEDISNM